MDLGLAEGLALIAGGLIAGFVNTVAGGGSAISLPVLVEVLGDPLLANGTNRVAILLQNSVGVANFHRARAVPWAVVRPLVLPVLAGAGGGSWLATQADPDTIEVVFAIAIIGVALSVLVSPSRWKGGTLPKLTPRTGPIVFFAIGFYGGFIQAGVGFLLLAGLVLGAGLNLVTGNAAKVALILAFTAIALPVFFLAGQVSLIAGGVLSVGNMTGAWLASNLAIKRGADWIRWVVVFAALVAAARMLLR